MDDPNENRLHTKSEFPGTVSQERQTLWQASYQGFKANLIPGIVIQVIATIVVCLYYLVPAARPAFGFIERVSLQWPFPYAMLMTMLFLGWIPLMVFIAMGRLGRVALWKQFMFFTVYWLYKGAEVKALYWGLELWLGDKQTFWIIVVKVVIDQLLYNPLWAAWTCCAGYLLKDLDFDVKLWWGRIMERRFWTFTVPSLLFSTWIVWIPGTALIYSLPGALQIPLFNLVGCFFVCVLAFITGKSAEENRAELETET